MTDAHQLNREAAIRAHETINTGLVEGFNSTISSASGALKLLSTLNAGGIIALLGFIGAIAGKDKQIFTSAQPFILPMTLFGFGLICSAIASCGMYFAQLTFSSAPTKMLFNFQHPYAHETTRSRRIKWLGIGFQIATILCATTAFVLFVIGLYFCRDLILSAKL